MTDRLSGTPGLVSVIMPAHNAAEFIQSTIQSVIAQTYPHWEILVANDASTDTTASIVAEMARSDQRIRLLDVPPVNGLAARARNHAMRNARGEFFALLDADDQWTRDKLARQVKYLRDRPDVDGICAWHDYFGDASATELHNRLANPARSPLFSSSPVCERAEIVRGCPFLTSTVMFRRHCFERIGGMDEDARLRSGQDYEYFARLVTTFRFHRIPAVLTHYRLAAPKQSLSSGALAHENTVGWNVYNVLMEKDVLTKSEARQRRGALYYDQAKNNLFRLEAPFRMALFRSIMTGAPPKEAVVVFALSILPRKLLRRTLMGLLALQKNAGGRGRISDVP